LNYVLNWVGPHGGGRTFCRQKKWKIICRSKNKEKAVKGRLAERMKLGNKRSPMGSGGRTLQKKR